MQGLYGKDTDKFIDLARRAQAKATREGFVRPESFREIPLVDYTKSALETPVSVHMGMTDPINLKNAPANATDVFHPMGMDAGAAFSTISYRNVDPTTGKRLADITVSPVHLKDISLENLKGLLGHEATHAFGTNAPNTNQMKVLKDRLTQYIQNYGEEAGRQMFHADLPQIEQELGQVYATDITRFPTVPNSRFASIVPQDKSVEFSRQNTMEEMAKAFNISMKDAEKLLNAQTMADVHPNVLAKAPHLNFANISGLRQEVQNRASKAASDVRNYFSNIELPGQITDTKLLLRDLGYPHVNANMTAEEAARIAKEVQEKLQKGIPFTNTYKRKDHILNMLELLKTPEGKRLFDLQAKRNKGSEVSDKINDMRLA